jgi:hypothetical protein
VGTLETVAEDAASRRTPPGAVTAVEISIAATVRLSRRIVIRWRIETANDSKTKETMEEVEFRSLRDPIKGQKDWLWGIWHPIKQN